MPALLEKVTFLDTVPVFPDPQHGELVPGPIETLGHDDLQGDLERASMLIARGGYFQQESDVDTALEMDPSRADVWFFRAHTKQALGDAAGAAQDAAEAARLGPKY